MKPDNILVVFESDREKFKLADFGFAEFREYTASSGHRLTALMRGGTEDFGALQISLRAQARPFPRLPSDNLLTTSLHRCA